MKFLIAYFGIMIFRFFEVAIAYKILFDTKHALNTFQIIFGILIIFIGEMLTGQINFYFNTH